MLRESYPCFLGNQAILPNTDLVVYDKYSGAEATRVPLASKEMIEQAIGLAVQAIEPMRALAAYERQAILLHCVKRFTERAEELALSLCIEAGKPIRDARGEVSRLIDTFRIAAEETTRIYGEIIPLDISPRAHGYQGMWKRIPLGVCSLISPFNFPLNLAAHKIAPAIAAGCPFLLKPASATPIGALLIGEILAETSLPSGAFSILPTPREGAALFTTDERIKLLSFTGSPEVGWALKAQAGKKKVVLELGGNAGVILDHDTDLNDAIPRLIMGAFYQSGQSCISVQRIFLHDALYDEAKAKLIAAAKQLKIGDPREEETFIGPMIAEKEAKRLQRWIDQAVQAGATLLCGGTRQGAIMPPTLLEGVPQTLPLCADEAFGPVAILERFHSFDDALERINDSRYGLQAGVFTRDLYKAQRAWERLDVGGVLINDVPSWRVDHMPYGGVKESGLGREGIRWAIEEMTEIRLFVLRTPPHEATRPL